MSTCLPVSVFAEDHLAASVQKTKRSEEMNLCLGDEQELQEFGGKSPTVKGMQVYGEIRWDTLQAHEKKEFKSY